MPSKTSPSPKTEIGSTVFPWSLQTENSDGTSPGMRKAESGRGGPEKFPNGRFLPSYDGQKMPSSIPIDGKFLPSNRLISTKTRRQFLPVLLVLPRGTRPLRKRKKRFPTLK